MRSNTAEAQLITNVQNSWDGRTHPSPCNDQHTYLVIVNDEVDTIQMPIASLLHHVDEDFYAKYYPDEALHTSFHERMGNWHNEE